LTLTSFIIQPFFGALWNAVNLINFLQYTLPDPVLLDFEYINEVSQRPFHHEQSRASLPSRSVENDSGKTL